MKQAKKKWGNLKKPQLLITYLVPTEFPLMKVRFRVIKNKILAEMAGDVRS